MIEEQLETAPKREPAPSVEEVPRYVPPRGNIHKAQVYGLRELIRFRGNTLSVFPEAAFRWSVRTWRVLNRKVFVVNRPELVREAFQHKHQVLQRKSPQMRRALIPLLGDGLFVSDGDVWKHRRAAVAPIVHARHIETFFPIMVQTALEWREAWTRNAEAGKEIDIINEMGLLTAEVISRSVFGENLGRQYTGEIIAGFTEYQRHADQLAIADMLRLPKWFPRGYSRATLNAAKRIHDVIDGIIDKRREERESGRGTDDDSALIERLFESKDGDGNPFDREAVRNEAIVIFMAGHETTANTLSWAFYLISRADWARDALHRELDEVLQGRIPTYQDLQSLPYTRAIIEETLRLYPPVPILGRESTEATSVGECPVGKGALVATVPWLLHRNGDLWERPDDFVPERFLPGRPRPSKYQYIPFAVGPRICPGLTFGLVEAVTCLAILCQRFELTPLPGVEAEPTCRLTLRPGNTLHMRLRQRDRIPEETTASV